MRKLLSLLLPALLICLCTSPSLGRKTDDLYISITLKRGERSRDSGSRTTTISLAQDQIIYERSYHGMGASRQKPVRKEFRLGAEEKERLIELIRARILLVEDTVKYPLANSGIVRYFEISVRLKLNGQTGAVSIEGPRNAVKIKDQKLYQNSTALIEEIYRILNLMDKEITYEALIN